MKLLILLFLCHFLADYTHLSVTWMLNAKRKGEPYFPIFCHAGVHALLMALVVKCFSYNWTNTIVVYAFQLSMHFWIDVWKGKMNIWFPSLQNPANKWHWWVFGFDQFLHAVVIILIYFFITKYQF